MTSPIKTVGLVAKPSQPAALTLCLEVMNFLRQRGLQFRVDRDSAAGLGSHVASDEILPRSELSRQCQLIVVLGGDGTLISVGHHAAPQPPAIIGVNLGTLGFLTEISREELFVTLDLALNGNAKIERRPLLRATVESRLEGVKEFYAINDIVVSKEAIARIFGVNVSIDGDHAAVIRGDGVIVCTPCGSTAYNLAAGGSIVHPQVDAMLLTPLCPHSLTSRPLVIPGSAKIAIDVISDLHGKDEVYLTVDGQQGRALAGGDRVLIQTSEHSVGIVKSPSRTYYQLLSLKLKWANQ